MVEIKAGENGCIIKVRRRLATLTPPLLSVTPHSVAPTQSPSTPTPPLRAQYRQPKHHHQDFLPKKLYTFSGWSMAKSAVFSRIFLPKHLKISPIKTICLLLNYDENVAKSFNTFFLKHFQEFSFFAAQSTEKSEETVKNLRQCEDQCFAKILK